MDIDKNYIPMRKLKNDALSKWHPFVYNTEHEPQYYTVRECANAVINYHKQHTDKWEYTIVTNYQNV
jgi:hypothetical protein